MSVNPFSYAIDSLRSLINNNYVDWGQYGIAIGLLTVLGGLSFVIAKNAIKIEP